MQELRQDAGEPVEVVEREGLLRDRQARPLQDLDAQAPRPVRFAFAQPPLVKDLGKVRYTFSNQPEQMPRKQFKRPQKYTTVTCFKSPKYPTETMPMGEN